MSSLFYACATLPAPGDYTSLTQEQTFNHGVRRVCEDITIVPDSTNEVVAEVLSVMLYSNDSAVTLGQNAATVFIGTSYRYSMSMKFCNKTI